MKHLITVLLLITVAAIYSCGNQNNTGPNGSSDTTGTLNNNTNDSRRTVPQGDTMNNNKPADSAYYQRQ